MLFNKLYPHTITLRTRCIALAGVGFILIMIYVVYLVDNSPKTKSDSHDANSAIHQYANDSDIPSALKGDASTPKKGTSATVPSHSTVATTSNIAQPNSIIPIFKQDDSKDMSAPINSNQITLDNNVGTTNNSPSLASSNVSSATGDDQNLQSEKKAFLQISGQSNLNDYLGASLQSPISKYEVQAGSIVPCVLITGIDSDLPGQITAQVRSNVYDSITGNYLLIPQGAKLIGLYDSQIAYGQERVLIAWNRIIFPNGKSIDLDGMPGIDLSGYAGFNDEVNNHYFKIFSSVLLMSALSAGAQLSQPQQSSSIFAPPTVGQTLAQSLGTNISNTGNMIAQKNLSIQPTLTIRPGYEFNISVTKDMVFPIPYAG